MTIVIDEQVENEYELEDLMKYVKGLVAEGFTSGYYPHWHIED